MNTPTPEPETELLPTPKTDAVTMWAYYMDSWNRTKLSAFVEDTSGGSLVYSDFARELERECATLAARLAEEHEKACVLQSQVDNNDVNLDQVKALLKEWRMVAQSITPGGSEFMSPETVRSYIQEFKTSAHEAKKDRVKAHRQKHRARKGVCCRVDRMEASGFRTKGRNYDTRTIRRRSVSYQVGNRAPLYARGSRRW